MEQTTLQQRIEQRAAIALKNDLMAAYNLQTQIRNLLGEENYPSVIDVKDRSYMKYGDKSPEPYNERAQKIYETLLPAYVSKITDEILHKIDEIDYLLQETEMRQENF